MKAANESIHTKKNLCIIGGGAAGFFAAITAAETNPSAQVHLFEQSAQPLGKVKVSGGGRCNVTHDCTEPSELIKHYPRGGRELLGPFNHFGVQQTIDWFRNRGVMLKTEADGRMFPVTDDSSTIVNCLMQAAKDAGVKLHLQSALNSIQPPGENQTTWKLGLGDQAFEADRVLIATGSSEKTWKKITSLGHTVIEPVPSLFTFHIQDPRIKDLAGISVPAAIAALEDSGISQQGPVLITHWGLSGPAILKLSAWAARELHRLHYKFSLLLNWTGKSLSEVQSEFDLMRKEHAKRMVRSAGLPGIPQRLWERWVTAAGIGEQVRWADLPAKGLKALTQQACECHMQVSGKSTFKEEFVTAGGVKLSEMDFKTLQSKLHKGLFFAGEVLDIDAVTGGFNFQAAWTTGYLAGKAMAL